MQNISKNDTGVKIGRRKLNKKGKGIIEDKRK